MMASPPEIQRIYELRALAYEASEQCRAAWDELRATSGWRLLACMRLRREADAASELAAGYCLEAGRLLDEWEAGLR